MAKNDNEKLEILTGIVDRDSKTYSFEKTLSMVGEQKTGTFVAKYMGIGARLKLGTIRAKLLDGAPIQSVDTITDDLAYMIAYLSVALIKTPKWFNYDEIDDYQDIRDLYLEVYNFMQNFRGKNESNTNAGDSKDAVVTPPVEDMQRVSITTESPSDSGN